MRNRAFLCHRSGQNRRCCMGKLFPPPAHCDSEIRLLSVHNIFQGAYDSFYIVFMYLLGRGRVRFTQAPVHPGRSFSCASCSRRCLTGLFSVSSENQYLYYGLDIKSCTSGENRILPFGVNFIHGLCHLLELDDMKLLPGSSTSMR